MLTETSAGCLWLLLWMCQMTCTCRVSSLQLRPCAFVRIPVHAQRTNLSAPAALAVKLTESTDFQHAAAAAEPFVCASPQASRVP